MVGVCFFFFKQKTAYEITEGDWSSDVCSSDLTSGAVGRRLARPARGAGHPLAAVGPRSEERRVGKGVLSCVDLGGRRIIKKKKDTKGIYGLERITKYSVRVANMRR